MMSWAQLGSAISQLSVGLQEHRQAYQSILDRIPEKQWSAALNLLDYIYLRAQNLEEMQQTLSQYGLSSLGRMEHDVFGHLSQVQRVIERLDDGAIGRVLEPYGSAGRLELNRRCQDLFGQHPASLPTFMVTLPRSAQSSVAACRELIRSGMNIARLNCSKMESQEALFAAAVVREAASLESKPVLVSFELGGPKMRVLEIAKRKKSVRLNLGTGVGDRGVFEGALSSYEFHRWLSESRPAKKRGENESLRNGHRDDALEKVRKAAKHSHAKKKMRRFKSVSSLHITWEHEFEILWPAAFGILEQGSRFVFDDGQLEAVVAEVGIGPQAAEAGSALEQERQPPYLLKARVAALHGGEHKLKVGQGCNIPGYAAWTSCLTDKDVSDLKSLAHAADLIGFSFIRGPQDVSLVYDTLLAMNRLECGVIFKIETSEAVRELPSVLLEILRFPKAGVMIARGDLALQIGFERLIDIQQEILWFCSAARLPVVWATQVLDHLATTGLPTRAEVSDVALASEADCIMLNRGLYLEGTLQFLQRTVTAARGHQDKKFNKLRRLNVAQVALREPRVLD